MSGFAYTTVFLTVAANVLRIEAQNLLIEIGEIQKPFNLTCNISQIPEKKLAWRKDGGQIVVCGPSVCTEKDGYYASISNEFSILTILNSTRQSEASYVCEINPSTAFTTYNFKVYARPETVSCGLRIEENTVKVACNVTKAYPSSLCLFTWILNTTETAITGIPETKSTQEGNYFNTVCTLNLPGQNFSLGTHKFKVLAYPNITGTDSDKAYGQYNSLTDELFINYPVIHLKTNTSNYVEENEMITGACEETANTFILANTSLSGPLSILCSGLRNTTCSFTARRNMVLTCQAELPNGIKNSITFKPLVAYGPDNVTVKVMSNQMERENLDLCDKTQSLTITVNCSASEVSPNATFQFYINGTVIENPNDQAALTYSVKVGGLLSVSCTGNNSEFPSLTKSHQKAITITEPPSSPIIETYQAGGTSGGSPRKVLKVQEGVNIITCRVEGGYPSVSRLLLNCANQSQKTEANMITVDVNVTRRDDSSYCSCTAVHSSSCYQNNMTASTLDVHFKPTVTSWRVNSIVENKTLELEKNSTVNFFCEAEGNPSPVLSLRKDGGQFENVDDVIIPGQKFNLTLKTNKTMADCRDTGVYVCQAQEGQTVASKAINVFVKCVQELEYPHSQNTIYTGHINSTIEITILVLGYPEPRDEDLHLEGTRFTLKNDTYSLTYVTRTLPYGNVSAKFYDVSPNVFQNYTLYINNSQGSLVYNFEITEGESAQPVGPPETPNVNVGAIVGGIVAGIVVILAAVLVFVCLKRKGIVGRGKGYTDGHASLNERPASDDMVEINNSDLYYRYQHRKSDEVVIDNSDIYYMNRKPDEDTSNMNWTSDEVVIDNSEIYNMGRNNPVVIDNSEIYNMGRNNPGAARDLVYKNYSEVIPTITSAAAVPPNFKSSYEDVALTFDNKTKEKPPTAVKPKPAPKPKPGEQSNDSKLQAGKRTNAEDTYATVVKDPKSNKAFVVHQEEDSFFLDPSQQPDIPDREYEKDIENEKTKASLTKINNGSDHEESGSPHQDANAFTYTNRGFSGPDDEVNIYANI